MIIQYLQYVQLMLKEINMINTEVVQKKSPEKV